MVWQIVVSHDTCSLKCVKNQCVHLDGMSRIVCSL